MNIPTTIYTFPEILCKFTTYLIVLQYVKSKLYIKTAVDAKVGIQNTLALHEVVRGQK